jgi:hypothetical protein
MMSELRTQMDSVFWANAPVRVLIALEKEDHGTPS